jgi:hypothetical protein
MRAFGNYKIGKGWGLQLFSFYRGRQVQLQGIQGGFGIYSLAVRKDFNNKKGSIGFGAENFFTSSIKVRNELTSPILYQRSINEMRNMNFKVTFSYRIGKMSMDSQPRRRKKSISNDDVKEGGESGGTENAAPQGGGGAPQGGGQQPAQGQKPAQGQAPGQGQGQKPGQPATTPGQQPAQQPANTNTQPPRN